MQRNWFPPWAKRALIVAGPLLLVGFVVAAWVFSSVLRGDLLLPDASDPEPDLKVVSVGSGRIVVTRTDLSAQEGIWGVVGEHGYGQVTTVIEVRETEVERSFRTLEGDFAEGDLVAFDQYAFTNDPETAHGIPFDNVRIPGDLGGYPAWLVQGDRDTWVIFIHGKGVDERHQALRIIPALEEERFPVLVITYRNDIGAPQAPSGLYGWGLEEWRDVDAAIRFGQSRGAEDFVLMGASMGGAIAAMSLHESDLIPLIRGVILDSPVLDLEAVVDAEARNRHLPGPLNAAAKGLARVRFGIDWAELDQVARADQFDVPILLMHGSADETVPVESSDQFADAAPEGLVTYERFEGADHVFLWNTDPVRYERVVLDFVLGLTFLS